ncbi:alpha/beta hydrolase family protein [Rhizobium oryzicola]|uniref:Alpha/beta fold hydrolase n=1 Tax=Rhizobium oryzicola TaxID=1232668 RepID=A0ABT8SSN8_9HYPH|nr:alpha/beta fold hydrolase [Rhizobium oryzicola]MDO1581412.1 alpha/beta fold hydrolase [Rhizobium oryzicola]
MTDMQTKMTQRMLTDTVLTRRTVLGGAAGIAATTLMPLAARAEFPIPDVLPLEKTDYAVARRSFRTKLIQKGPAPDDYKPLGDAPGARKVLYPGGPNGSIGLIAWISDNQVPTEKKPAVLFLHGGNSTGEGHWLLMKSYVDAGYVAMLPSMRGENGQPGNFSGFYDEVDDVLSAAHYLSEQPGVDKSRVFLAGHSVGGTLALLSAMAHPFRAAVAMAGNPDAWRFFSRFSQDIRFDVSDPQEFVMRSAGCFAPSLKCPMLMTRGTEEGQFTERHQLFMSRVKDAGQYIDAMSVPGNHNGAVPGEILESIRFFKERSV